MQKQIEPVVITLSEFINVGEGFFLILLNLSSYWQMISFLIFYHLFQSIAMCLCFISHSQFIVSDIASQTLAHTFYLNFTFNSRFRFIQFTVISCTQSHSLSLSLSHTHTHTHTHSLTFNLTHALITHSGDAFTTFFCAMRLWCLVKCCF